MQSEQADCVAPLRVLVLPLHAGATARATDAAKLPCFKQVGARPDIERTTHTRRFQPVDAASIAQLRRLLAFSRPFVQRLSLQLSDAPMDLQLLFDILQLQLTSLRLHYSPKALGMGFDSAASGMRLSDCRALARALARAETLVVLDLSHNGLDDDKARMLSSGLADNISITQLNLSHNAIADRGVRALAKVLDGASTVTCLDLSCNQLQPDSGRALARVLTHSRALTRLLLRLNRLGDEGCRAICDALVPGSSAPAAAAAPASAGRAAHSCQLEVLDISSNGAGLGLVPSLCSMLRCNSSLTQLDVSCNALGDRLASDLVSAFTAKAASLAVELRGCKLGDAAECAVRGVMVQQVLQVEALKLAGGGQGG